MNMDKKAGHGAPEATLPHVENEKGTVPGQQIGLYSKADNRDLRQMVRMLNSPQEQSQKDRG